MEGSRKCRYLGFSASAVERVTSTAMSCQQAMAVSWMSQCQTGGETDRATVQEHSVAAMTRAQHEALARADALQDGTGSGAAAAEETGEDDAREAAEEMNAHCKGGHRSKLKHPINIRVPCSDCIAGSMRGDYTHKGGSNKVRDLETVCSDIGYLG